MKKWKPFRVITIVLAALLTLVAIESVSLMLDNYLTGYYISSENSEIYDWKFRSSTSETIFDDDTVSWKYADRGNGIRKPVFDDFLVLSTTLPEQREDGLLIVLIHGDDIQVLLDGVLLEPVIETSPLTLKRTVRIPLGISEGERNLTLKVRTGMILAFRATVTTSERAEMMEQMRRDVKIPLITTLILAGFIVFILSLSLSVKLKKIAGMAWTGLFLIGTAAGVFISERLDLFSLKSKYLSIYFDGSGYPKEIVFLLSLLLLSVYAVFLHSTGNREPVARLFLALLLLGGILQGVPVLEAYHEYKIFGYSALLMLSAIIYIFNYRNSLKEKHFIDRFHSFTFILAVSSMVYDFLNPILKLYSGKGGIFYLPFALFAISSIYLSVNQAIHINVRIAERAEQSRRNRAWIERIFEESSKIFANYEYENFCIQTALSTRKLITEDMAENRLAGSDGSPEGVKEPSLCVAIKDSETGRYKEIFSRGVIEGCDYSVIEKRYLKKNRGGIYFGGTYVSMLLFVNGGPGAIIYIEGLEHGISAGLKNILDIAYSNVAIALDNLKLKEDILHTRESVFTYLAEMTEAKSEETGMHLKRVSEYVRAICEEMGMSTEESRVVAIGSMMHDVGKLAIPEELINKKGRLTEEEYDTVKQHVRYGNNMLSKSDGEYMHAGAVIAQQHHEKWDGSGYLGLAGEQIHKYARITALADVFDALTSTRSYKTAWSTEEACGYIMEKSGTQFDPEAVTVFVRCIDRIREIRHRYPD
ncbi:MAG: HD domain-containing phosphohydrolase [Saccharofermentanales bacterium]